ncbi:UcrQ family [Nesidiocoris tenuis]|uniref:Cytochrome b-c1 complex subunit 8 n=1 Tax=Nesidiocoris tenuis TaxID=355587 RepID=A0ABN7BAW1_9HEMI|nr:UcrQ family [Nesidiocoris tenuis]
MKLSTVNHAHGFGGLGVYIRGLVTYRLSPFEQKAFAGASNFLPKTMRRLSNSAIFIVPPFIMTYLVISQTEKKFQQMCRKNPEDYVNDK